MLAAARNYDVICLQMRNYLPLQEQSIKRETNRFLKDVKAIIVDEGSIKPKLDKFIPQIFNYRLRALKWLSQQPDIDFVHLLDKAIPYLERLRSNPKLKLLAENVLFAVRCNSKVLQSVIGDVNSDEFSKEFADVPVTTYEQFFGTLALSIPDQETFQTIADFSHASLYIEFIILAAILIDEEDINISEGAINELAFLIADAAQEYSAIASMMGILPIKQTSSSKSTGTPNSTDEDKLLSDLGLSDYAKNF
jgi:hypothetical protein